jgi:hypothetical protein
MMMDHAILAAKACDGVDYGLSHYSSYDRAAAFVTSIVVLLPRPAYGRRTTASARATVVTPRQTRKKPIAASIARGMKTCRRRKLLDARMIGRRGVFQIKDGPKGTALENLKAAGAQQAHN